MIAAQVCITEALTSISQDERISFVFDRHDIYEDVMQRLFRYVFQISKADQRVVGPPTFWDKSLTVCLDPADYLAFQIREYRTNKNSRKAELGMSLLGDGDAAGFIYSRDNLQKFVSTMVAHGVVPGKTPQTVPVMRLTEKRFTNRTNLLKN